MKKSFIFILLTILILTLSACTKSSNEVITDNNTVTDEVNEPEDSADSESLKELPLYEDVLNLTDKIMGIQAGASGCSIRAEETCEMMSSLVQKYKDDDSFDKINDIVGLSLDTRISENADDYLEGFKENWSLVNVMLTSENTDIVYDDSIGIIVDAYAEKLGE